MAGRFVKSKDLVPVSSLARANLYLGKSSRLDGIVNETKGDRALERFSDDPPEAGSSLDEPYLFSEGPNRTYFQCWFDERLNQPLQLYSVYSFFAPHNANYLLKAPLNCVIILIVDGTLVMGHFKADQLVSKQEVTGRRGADGSEANPKSFLKEAMAVIRSWNDRLTEAEGVFVRCSKVHYNTLWDHYTDKQMKKYSQIPFVTCPPSVPELKRIYSKLMTACRHPFVEETLAALQEERRSWTHSSKEAKPLSLANSSKKERKMKRQHFPWLEPKIASLIRDSVVSNDADRLAALLDSLPAADIAQYLSSCQSKLNGGNWLHYSVRNAKIPIVELLLELGVDPTVEDERGLVPFEYCKGAEVEEVFINFREEGGANFDWNRAKVPSWEQQAQRGVERPRRDFKVEMKAIAREKREHRRAKLDKRRIKVEE